jgi:transcriptional regulator with XRE-family HTH domain
MATIADVVGAKVKAHRLARGLKQVDLSIALGTVHHVISRMESGGGISLRRVMELAVLLDREPAELLPSLAECRTLFDLSHLAPLPEVDVDETPRGDAYVQAVIDGARQYLAEHGRPPQTTSGPAQPYVGFGADWLGIHNTLAKGNFDVPACGGLRALLVREGIILDGRALEDAIAEGARRFVEEHGRRPVKTSGDASAYVGQPGSWSYWSQVLARGHRGTMVMRTLHQFLDKRGIGTTQRPGPVPGRR